MPNELKSCPFCGGENIDFFHKEQLLGLFNVMIVVQHSHILIVKQKQSKLGTGGLKMRDYLFRGKRKDNGEWVEGSLILTTSVKEKTYIVDSCYCYEKPSDFCHRHLVADWLNKNGVECKELEDEI